MCYDKWQTRKFQTYPGKRSSPLKDISDSKWNLILVFSLLILQQREYIGLTDRIEEKKFVWIDGSPLVYSNWGAGDSND